MYIKELTVSELCYIIGGNVRNLFNNQGLTPIFKYPKPIPYPTPVKPKAEMM
ncbi:hypothetical protein [Streptococcus pacificus]|uniref:Uncharacterized protein n=1 Tax=Streptococcus pacificus TaxID=2740577 RepID=A0ABS0ZJ85_9STRE|nr:hypothetical protein [Streptococcus pacificus]MBJ8326059.1 hypothetical protein [Streptococcus pacificus]